MYYFDHSATTPPYDEVVETVAEVMKMHFGNPSSIHRLGMEAERLVGASREVIAEALNLRARNIDIIFTSGGTESNNLAIKGAAFRYRSRGNRLVTTGIEHASVYECFRQLEQQHGFDVVYVPVDRSGSVRLQDVMEAVDGRTVLVSVMHVNNETGRIQPVEAIGSWLKRSHPKIIFHVDAVQSVGKLPLDPHRSGIDLLSLSAHKLRGPKGVGALCKKAGLALSPLLAGGGQESGVRSGTENVPFIVGMAKAIRMSMEQLESNRAHLVGLRARMIEQIGQIPGLLLSGSSRAEEMAPHIVHFCLPGLKSEVVVHALEAHDVYVSSKSACASGEDRPSRVLLEMGLDAKLASSGIRVSLSPMHTDQDIAYLAEKLRVTVARLQSMAGMPRPAGRAVMHSEDA